MASKAIFIVVFALGLFMLLDGYVAAASGGGQTTTGLCQTGLVDSSGNCITSSGTLVSTSGTYTTTIVNGGSTTTATVTGPYSTTVSYNPSNVPITITANPVGTAPTLPVTFTATPFVPPSGLVIWAWNFGDGSTSTAGAKVSHAYSAQGTYVVSVSLNAGNEYGNAQTTMTVSCISLAAGALGCATPTLTVNVVSGYTGTPLNGATVTVTQSGGPSQTGTTNSAGQAIFPVAPNTQYTVTATDSSYTSSSTVVSIGTGGASASLTLNFNCGRQSCPQSIFGGITNGALSPALEMIIGAILALAGGFGAVRRKR